MTGEGRAPCAVLKVAPASRPVSVAGAIAGVIRSQQRVEVHAIERRRLTLSPTWSWPTVMGTGDVPVNDAFSTTLESDQQRAETVSLPVTL
jgi:hypothetical protein